MKTYFKDHDTELDKILPPKKTKMGIIIDILVMVGGGILVAWVLRG